MKKQRAAAELLRRSKDTSLAVEVLRGRRPVTRELRDAIADLLERKIRRKPGPKSAWSLPAAELKRLFRADIKLMVAQGYSRDEAIAKEAALNRISESTLRRLMGYKGRH